MVNAAGLETMSILRKCRLQTARNNVESSTPEEYWRRAVFVAFMDHVVKEFEERFSQLSENCIRGLKVIPSRVTSLSAEDEDVIIQHFKDDLPSPGSFTQKVRRWKTFWAGRSEELPSTLSDTFN